MQVPWLKSASDRTFDFICLWLLPLGLLELISGLFFLPNNSVHEKLFYCLFNVPALIALCLRPHHLKTMLREPLVIFFLVFIAWAFLSIAWSDGDNSASNLIKKPVHIFIFYVGCMLLVRYREESLKPVIFISALIGIIASVINLYVYARGGDSGGVRMIGGGAFDNPLLSSHVFGFFCVYWLSICMTTRRPLVFLLSGAAMLIMFSAVLATGSRTPLVALTLAVLWLVFICWNKRSLLLIGSTVALSVIVVACFSDMIFERGNSYRFELWQGSLAQIADHPWIGHGYNSLITLTVEVGSFHEPHSFALGVLFYIGIIGFIPWALMQIWALLSSWRQRQEPMFITGSAWMAFGIGAMLTEGGAIVSQPKEHWFLLWIPLAIIAALSIANRAEQLPKASKYVGDEARAKLYIGAQVIEADHSGPKVLKLADGSFLKVFRRRRWYTSGSFLPYAERFTTNTRQLLSMGISAPAVIDNYRFADLSSAVHYTPLPGFTVRQELASMDDPIERASLIKSLGAFLALLHERGVYFRSLHLGNVLIMEHGQFGLIDVADMRLFPSPLRRALRRRNQHHMRRYTEDRNWLFSEHLNDLLAGYASLAGIDALKAFTPHAINPT